MSELRQDPISGQWVIIAPERAGRPDQYGRDRNARATRACPFCAGNEHLTSAPLLELPSEPGSAAAWRIRVLPNKYPAVAMREQEATGEANGDARGGDAKGTVPCSPREPSLRLLRQKLEPRRAGMNTQSPGLGQHEVVVESAEHLQSVTELSNSQFADVVLVYRDRLQSLAKDPRLVSGLVFKNMGADSGATLEHVHSQIVALPAVPERLKIELTGAAQRCEQHGTCAFCAMLENELADGVRVVAGNGSYVAFCPYAARMPYETWILPRRHGSHFEQISAAAAADLADLLRQVIGAVEDVSDGGAYNYVIHSAPFDMPAADHYHWHVEVIPRLTRVAGFEWGTGWHINPVTPEEAAQRLRNLLPGAEEKRSSAASLPIS